MAAALCLGKEPGEFTAYVDEDEVARDLPEMEDAVDSTGELINQQPMYDKDAQ